MPDSVIAENRDNSDERAGQADWANMPPLSSEAAQVIRSLAERAAAFEKGGQQVDELGLFHDRLKADLSLGMKVQRNSVLGDAPDLSEIPGQTRISLSRNFETELPSYEEVIRARRSVRDYTGKPVDLDTVGRLLWLGFGVKSHVRAYGRQGLPTFHAPTGGGLQSTRIFLIAHNISGLKRGVYEYSPDEHALILQFNGEVRWKMFELCAFQDWIAHASGIIALATDMPRVRWKYEERGYRLAHLDAGVIAQNMHLSATALGLGSCLVFGFVDEDMDRFLGLAGGSDEFSSLVMPFGHVTPRYSLARAQADD